MIHNPARAEDGSIDFMADHESLLSIMESLRSTAQVLGELNVAISQPRATIAEVATILRRDVILSARVVRTANSAFYFKQSAACKTIEEALQRVGLREIARLVSSATMLGLAPSAIRSSGVSSEAFSRGVLFAAGVSQRIASTVKLDANLAYLSGLMLPLGVMVLNQWAEKKASAHERLRGADGTRLVEGEKVVFEGNPVAVSSYITRQWAFPCEVSENLEKSLDPQVNVHDYPLAVILQIATTLGVINRAGFHTEQTALSLRKDQLAALGINSIQLREICRDSLAQTRRCDL